MSNNINKINFSKPINKTVPSINLICELIESDLAEINLNYESNYNFFCNKNLFCEEVLNRNIIENCILYIKPTIKPPFKKDGKQYFKGLKIVFNRMPSFLELRKLIKDIRYKIQLWDFTNKNESFISFML